MGKRYRDFRLFGRSLNFGWEDIDSGSKETALENTGKGDIGERDQEEVSREKEPEESQASHAPAKRLLDVPLIGVGSRFCT